MVIDSSLGRTEAALRCGAALRCVEEHTEFHGFRSICSTQTCERQSGGAELIIRMGTVGNKLLCVASVSMPFITGICVVGKDDVGLRVANNQAPATIVGHGNSKSVVAQDKRQYWSRLGSSPRVTRFSFGTSISRVPSRGNHVARPGNALRV